MNEPDPLNPLRHALEPPVGGKPTSECLTDDTISGFADGSLDAAVRNAALPHLATCVRCRGAVASSGRALADPAVDRELRALETSGRRPIYRIAIPVAAVAVLLLLVAPWPTKDVGRAGSHRAPTIAATETPVPISPSGAVATVSMLQWKSVLGADRYRVYLFDAGGRVVYEWQQPDTFVALPDSVQMMQGRTYLWKVDARTGFDRWVPSNFV